MKFQAVTRQQLIEILGRGCSPVSSRDGYVIGPDLGGRICHISTHFTLGEAQAHAKKLNTDTGATA